MNEQHSALLFKVIFIVTALLTATLFISTLVSTTRVTGDEIVIIDVRTLEEWNAGHLATAEHLQLDQVAESINTLVPNKDQQVFLYCRSGNRSGQAKIIMDRETGKSRGFGFVEFNSVEDAVKAKEAMDGVELDGRAIKVDYAQ